jgi:hypothetical protein
MVVAGVVAVVVVAKAASASAKGVRRRGVLGARPIEGVGTSTAAFVGLAPPPPR